MSPRGNGEDCHRFYEAIYLDSIPIVKRTNTPFDKLYNAFTLKDNSIVNNPNQKKWIKSMLNAPPGIWIFNSEYYRFSIDMKR